MSGLRDVKLNLIETLDDVLRFKEWLGERRPWNMLAFDTETTGLKIGSDIVRLVQVGDANTGWAMPWANEVGGGGRFIGGWAALFADVARTWEGGWLAHNAPYDCDMLEYMRVVMPRHKVLDTRIMAHIMAPHMSTALKSVASRLVDATAMQAQEKLSRSLSSGSGTWTWGTVPIDYADYWIYGAMDPVLTYRIGEILYPQVMADAPKAFQLENDVQWVVKRMERYGAHINVPGAVKKLAQFNDYVKQLGDWVEANYGIKPGANADVVRVLQEHGFAFSKATAAGAVALDKEVLGGIDHPLAQAVLTRRQYQKIASTYIKHFASDVDEDSLLHPSINTLGARTSRMSMSEPNLQNLPRRNEGNAAADAVRGLITAREGNIMLMCDFDQIEMRGLASMAGEDSMIAAFRDKTRDFFVSLAQMVYDDPTIVKADPRRQVIKNAGYATIYGAGIPKFALTAGISLEVAQRVRNRWDEMFPKVAAFQREVGRIAVERRVTEGEAYVRCPLTGRKQIGDPGKEYALVNYLIQGMSAAIFKTKLLQLDAAGVGQWMVAPVHDEIVLDVPEDDAPEVVRVLEAVMNDDSMLTVPISASVSYGSSWGSKKGWDWAEHKEE